MCSIALCCLRREEGAAKPAAGFTRRQGTSVVTAVAGAFVLGEGTVPTSVAKSEHVRGWRSGLGGKCYSLGDYDCLCGIDVQADCEDVHAIAHE